MIQLVSSQGADDFASADAWCVLKMIKECAEQHAASNSARRNIECILVLLLVLATFHGGLAQKTRSVLPRHERGRS